MHGNQKVIEKTGYLLKKELFLFRIIILEKAVERGIIVQDIGARNREQLLFLG